MKNLTKKAVLIVMLALLCLCSFVLAACNDSSETVRHADADSIEIVGTNTTFAPGEHTLEAKVKPAQADQGVRWSVTGEDTRGVSVGGESGNVLTVGANATDGAVITLRATSTYDTAVYVTRDYTLEIPEIEGTPIYTEEELRNIDLNGNYVLMNDIELTSAWDPIGTSEIEDENGVLTRAAEPFNGVFDGNGYTISNIQYEDLDEDSGQVVGFFEQIGGSGEVKNLGLQGSITVDRWSGGIAAINGGIISNCWSDIDVTCVGDLGAAGGLVSDNRGRVEYCYCIGAVSTPNREASTRTAGLFVNAGDAYACFGDADAMGTTYYQTMTGLIGNSEIMLSTSAMQTASTYEGWDSEVWSIVNGSYPQLINPDFEAEEEEPFVAITGAPADLDINTVYDYQITVEVSGVENTAVTFSLQEPVDGVSIDEETGLMTFDSETVADYSSVTVVAQLAASPETKATADITLINNDFAETNIYRVRNAASLYRVATDARYLGGDIILEEDIDISEYSWPGIGSVSAPFTGTFDGQGHTISGFNSTSSGLFGFVNAESTSTVAIKNVKLVGSINGSLSWGGGLVGTFQRGIIENCFVDVDIEAAEGQYFGGFVGVNSEEIKTKQTTIRNCISVGKVSAAGSVSTAGGFAAVNHGTLQNCYVDATNSGAVELLGNPAYMLGALNDCALYTDVEMRTASTFAGVLDEDIWYFSTGSWPTLRYEGFDAPAAESYLYIDFYTSIDVHTVTEQQLTAKVLSTSGSVDADGATFGLKGTVAGVTVSENGLITFGDDFVPATSFIVTVSYNDMTAEKVISTYSTGPVAIGTPEELYALTQAGADLSRPYYLTADIDLSDYSDWTGIGSKANPFTGTFDGRGHTISGFTSSKSGLFGGLTAATDETVIVQNLRLEGEIVVSASVDDNWIGGLSDYMTRGIVQNCIIDISMSSTIFSYDALLFSQFNGGTIRNSIILGEVGDCVTEGGWMKNIGVYSSGGIGATARMENVFVDQERNGATFVAGDGAEHAWSSSFLTTEEMKSAETYSAFDDTIWNIVEGDYPTLIVQTGADA